MTQNGLSHTVVLVFVVLACLVFSVSFFLASQSNTMEETLWEARQRKVEIEDNIKDLNELYIYRVSPLVTSGLGEHQGVDLKETETWLKEQTETYKLVGEDITSEHVVHEAAEQLRGLETRLDRLRHEKNTAQMRQERLSTAFVEIRDKKDRAINQLSSKLERLRFRAAEEERKYVELRNELEARNDDLATEIPKRRKEFENQEVRLFNTISYLKQTLEYLTRQEVIRRDLIEIQGEVFKPDIQNGFAFVNLGQGDNLTPGLRFRVFRKDKGGTRKWKGIITIKKIFDTFSFVSVVKVADPGDPITEGDYINNVFFNRSRTMHVVLIGKFERPAFKYNRLEIKRRLERIGIKIEETVSLRTDFVLLGKDPDITSDIDYNNYKTVRKIGIPVVDEEQAKEYIEYYLGD